MVEIINPKKLELIKELYLDIKQDIDGADDVRLFINEPTNDMAYISISGSSVSIWNDNDTMTRIVNDSDNIEVYPLTSKKVKINICFNNILMEVKHD